MKWRVLTYIVAMAVIAAPIIPTVLAAQESPVIMKQIRYAVINLGTFGGTSGSSANGINNKGLVTGYEALPSGDQHAFMWLNGHKSDLGTLGGPESGITSPANEKGKIGGEANTSAQDPLAENFCGFNNANTFLCLPVLWEDGVIAALPTLGGNNGEAGSPNNEGQMVGFAETATVDPSCVPPQVFDFEAALWEPKTHQVRELPPLPGDVIGAAGGINDKGQIVGASGPTCGPVSAAICAHAVLWQSGVPTDLGNLGGTMYNCAFVINNRGQVVGLSGLPNNTTFHAALWYKGMVNDLGTLPGDFSSLANGIDEQGQVVGQSCDINSNCRAFLWQNGTMTDLNTLVSAGSSLYLLAAESINSRGEIAGAAYDQSNGATPAFLAIPCDQDHADNKECEDAADGAADVSQRPQIILPEYIREQLRQRRGFKMFRPGVTAEQHDNQCNKNLVKNLDTLEATSTAAECIGDPSSGIADTRPDANTRHFYGHCGIDDSTNKLSGFCNAFAGFYCASRFDPQQCPVGAKPKSPGRHFDRCPPRLYDYGRPSCLI